MSPLAINETPLLSVQLWSDVPWMGGALLGSVDALTYTVEPATDEGLDGDDRFTLTVPADRDVVALAEARHVWRVETRDGAVRWWRNTGDRRRDDESDTTVTYEGVSLLLDLVDAAVCLDFSRASTTGKLGLDGTLTGATVAEFWSAVAEPSMAFFNSGTAPVALGTFDDASTVYDWTWTGGQSVLEVLRATVPHELVLRVDGTTAAYLDGFTTRGSTAPTLPIAVDGVLQALDTEFDVSTLATVVVGVGTEGGDLSQNVWRVTSADAGTDTITLVDPKGEVALCVLDDQLNGKWVRRIATNEFFQISDSDASDSACVLASWPVVAWTAGNPGGELVEIRETGPSTRTAADPTARIAAPGYNGIEWEVASIAGTTVTLALAAEYSTAPTLTAAQMVGRTVEALAIDASPVAGGVTWYLSAPLATTPGNVALFSGYGGAATFDADLAIGDLLVLQASGGARTTPYEITTLSADRTEAGFAPLIPNQAPLTGWPLFVDVYEATDAGVFATVTGWDPDTLALTLSNVTNLAVGQRLLFSSPPLAGSRGLLALSDPVAVASYGVKVGVLEADGIAAYRNLVSDGALRYYPEATVPPGWRSFGTASGSTVSRDTTSTYAGSYSIALATTNTQAQVLSELVPNAALPPEAELLSAFVPIRIDGAPWSPLEAAIYGFQPRVEIRIEGLPATSSVNFADIDAINLGTVILDLVTLPTGTWVPVVLEGAALIAPALTGGSLARFGHYAVRVSAIQCGPNCTVRVGGLTFVASATTPRLIVEGSGSNTLWGLVNEAILARANPRRTAASFTAKVTDVYAQDWTANATRQIHVGQTASVTDTRLGITNQAMRIVRVARQLRYPTETVLTLARQPRTATALLGAGNTRLLTSGSAYGRAGGNGVNGTPAPGGSGGGTPTPGTTPGTGVTTPPVTPTFNRALLTAAPAASHALGAFGATAAAVTVDGQAVTWWEDFTNVPAVALQTLVADAGATGSALTVGYRPDTTGDFVPVDGTPDLNTDGVAVSVAATGLAKGSAVAVTPAARRVVQCRLFTRGGDGVATPAIVHAYLEASPVAAPAPATTDTTTGGAPTPPPVTGYERWYDAQQMGAGDLLGDNVEQWSDLSGADAHMTTVGGGASYPAFAADAFGTGTPGIRWNAASDAMQFDAEDWTAFTVYAVVKLNSVLNTGLGGMLWYSGSEAGVAVYGFGTGVTQTVEAFGRPGVNTGLIETSADLRDAHVYAVAFDPSGSGDTYEVFLDGAQVFGDSPAGAANFAAQIIVGKYTSYALDGWIGELMIYPEKHDSTQRAAMLAYFQDKWGTP